MSSVLVGLQAQKDVLLRSVKEQESELVQLRQVAKLHQATLIQEREKSQRETSSLQSQLQAKVSIRTWTYNSLKSIWPKSAFTSQGYTGPSQFIWPRAVSTTLSKKSH